jgi:hypothetical protein
MDTNNSNTPAPVAPVAAAEKPPRKVSEFSAKTANVRNVHKNGRDAANKCNSAFVRLETARKNRKGSEAAANALCNAFNAPECAGLFNAETLAFLRGEERDIRNGRAPSRKACAILRDARNAAFNADGYTKAAAALAEAGDAEAERKAAAAAAKSAKAAAKESAAAILRAAGKSEEEIRLALNIRAA